MRNDPVPTKVIDVASPANGNPARVPTAFDDAVVWAAWLYYADQLKQSEVAKALKVSRATVVNLLQEARERGVVTISLRSDLATRTGVAHRLAERYGLVEALVIPSRGEASLVDRLGDAAARLLGDQLSAGDVIGIAWGRTVLAAARAMAPPEPVPRLTVVQVAGSSTASETFSPELCTSLMSSRLDARCVNLLAPALLSTAELRDRLMAEPMLVNQFEVIRSTTRLLFGVGDLGPNGTVRKSGFASEDVVARYVRAGATAVIIGRFIGPDGELVAGDLDGRMIGITLDDMRAVGVRICVAGGSGKREAIRSALAGRLATHLVTDVDSAQRLLE